MFTKFVTNSIKNVSFENVRRSRYVNYLISMRVEKNFQFGSTLRVEIRNGTQEYDKHSFRL